MCSQSLLTGLRHARHMYLTAFHRHNFGHDFFVKRLQAFFSLMSRFYVFKIIFNVFTLCKKHTIFCSFKL